MNDALTALLFFLPAAVGNATPIFLNKIPYLSRWDTPLDFGKRWHGRRILGDNKRLRGIVFGTLMGGVTAALASNLDANIIVTIPPFWVGSLLGFGALFGDAMESFIKRSRGLPPGQSWFPYDQMDYIIGGLLIIYPFVQLPFRAMVTIFIFFFCLHLAATYIGYVLGLRDQPI